MNAVTDTDAMIAMRSCIQKVATGQEYSKDLSFDEAHQAMRLILEDKADAVRQALDSGAALTHFEAATR